MVYIAILYIIILNSIITNKKDTRFLLIFSFIFFFIFLSLRFGQGTDYFNYKNLFLSFPTEYNDFFLKSYLFNVEPLFFLINIFVKKNNFSFQYVIIISALISCIFLSLALSKYSKWKTLSFCVLITNYFFYYQSALRQSISMSICLYAILDLIYNKKFFRYFIFIFLAMMFHSSALICFFVPILLLLKFDFIFNFTFFSVLIILGICFSLFIPKIMLFIFSILKLRYVHYVNNLSLQLNILPLIIRLVFAYLALFLYKKSNIEKGSFSYNIIYIYLFGTFFYSCFSTISIFSRFTDYFSIIEIIIFPNLLESRNRKSKSIFFILLLFLYSFLFIKDIKDGAKQDHYYSTKALDYPYITVLNKQEISKYKNIVQENKQLLLE